MKTDLSTIRRDWIDSAEHYMRSIPPGSQVSSDSVVDAIPEPQHRNWIGCLFARLVKSRKLLEIGRIPSKRPDANGRKISLYEVTQ